MQRKLKKPLYGNYLRMVGAPSNRSDPICFSPYLYHARNRVERFFNRIKQCRRVVTRYDRFAANYLAFVQLASNLQRDAKPLPNKICEVPKLRVQEAGQVLAADFLFEWLLSGPRQMQVWGEL